LGRCQGYYEMHDLAAFCGGGTDEFQASMGCSNEDDTHIEFNGQITMAQGHPPTSIGLEWLEKL